VSAAASARPRPAVDLRFRVAGDRSESPDGLSEGMFHTEFLDGEGGGEPSSLLVVMADSVEGHAGGKVATNLAVTTLNRYVARRFGVSPVPELLQAGVEDANLVLGRAIEEVPKLEGMACTLVGAALSGDRLHWASVGDAHLYLIRGGEARKLNVDHTYGGFLARVRAEGIEVEPEPGVAPDSLVSAVTGQPIGEIDCPDEGLALERGDRIVLASRQLGALDAARIVQAARGAAEAAQGVAALLDAARSAANGAAGMTVVVVDVVGHQAQAVPAAAQAARAAARAGTAQAAPARGSPVLDVLTGVAALFLFAGTAAGTWYGVGWLEAWRSAPPPAALTPQLASAPPPPDAGGGAESQPAPSLAAPPPPPSLPAASGEGGGALSFGAPPAPLPGAGSAQQPGPSPAPEAEGFRDPLAGGGEGPRMVPLPAGRFEMGSGAASVRAEERPRHTVEIRPFAIGSYEVTVAEYRRFAEATGRDLPQRRVEEPERTPVTGITWDDAYNYTRWLSRETGKRYRLPSEAEWEYAAGAGARTPFWWGNQAGENRAHCFDCNTGLDPRRPTEIGRFPANPFGLHDTAGNVAEWVHDCWHPNYQDAPGDGSVWEGGDCSQRVVRGGSFSQPSSAMRIQARAAVPATRADDALGFRVARDL